MIKFRKIYLILLIVVTAVILLLYVYQENEYKKEVSRIEQLEEIYKKKADELQKIRATLKACPISNLITPRSCYFDSGYRCAWNVEGEICAQK